ncbi:MAG: putative toxin-antitoxin system toxin component, PIN family [Burkholderiales bacterium]
MRVFLDTNVLVSAFATRGLNAELFELVLIEHELITGRTVLKELDKALRAKIKLPAARCAEAVDFVRTEAARVVEDAQQVDCKADADDRRVLGEAVAGDAEAFVTGDGALIALGAIGKMPVLSPRQFWESLRSK